MTEYRCITCKSLYKNKKDLILFHELKDCCGNIFDKMYICIHCDKKERMRKELSHLADIEKFRRLTKENEELLHNNYYDKVIGKKIIDVISNKKGHTQIKLENGIVINFEQYPYNIFNDDN